MSIKDHIIKVQELFLDFPPEKQVEILTMCLVFSLMELNDRAEDYEQLLNSAIVVSLRNVVDKEVRGDLAKRVLEAVEVAREE